MISLPFFAVTVIRYYFLLHVFKINCYPSFTGVQLLLYVMKEYQLQGNVLTLGLGGHVFHE